jgi:hypothetical protein
LLHGVAACRRPATLHYLNSHQRKIDNVSDLKIDHEKSRDRPAHRELDAAISAASSKAQTAGVPPLSIVAALEREENYLRHCAAASLRN